MHRTHRFILSSAIATVISTGTLCAQGDRTPPPLPPPPPQQYQQPPPPFAEREGDRLRSRDLRRDDAPERRFDAAPPPRMRFHHHREDDRPGPGSRPMRDDASAPPREPRDGGMRERPPYPPERPPEAGPRPEQDAPHRRHEFHHRRFTEPSPRARDFADPGREFSPRRDSRPERDFDGPPAPRADRPPMPRGDRPPMPREDRPPGPREDRPPAFGMERHGQFHAPAGEPGYAFRRDRFELPARDFRPPYREYRERFAAGPKPSFHDRDFRPEGPEARGGRPDAPSRDREDFRAPRRDARPHNPPPPYPSVQ